MRLDLKKNMKHLSVRRNPEPKNGFTSLDCVQAMIRLFLRDFNGLFVVHP